MNPLDDLRPILTRSAEEERAAYEAAKLALEQHRAAVAELEARLPELRLRAEISEAFAARFTRQVKAVEARPGNPPKRATATT